jgi:thioredoxin 1
MLKALDSAHLDGYVAEEGVTIVDWSNPKEATSRGVDRVLEHASEVHGDVRFGAVDVSREPALAREWDVEEAPTLMAYRDGVLVFSQTGPLPESAVDELIDTIWALDMDEIKRGRDGQGGPIVISYVGGESPSFEALLGDK